MRFAKVIGTVTLSQSVAEFEAATLKAVVPLTLEELQKKDISSTGFLVMWDELGVGYGDIVALSEGGEAAQPFRPELKPVDAYNAAILDELDVS